MFRRHPLIRPPLPEFSLHKVDPNHEHDHDISTEYLRARLGFWVDLRADLLTLAVAERRVLGYAFTEHDIEHDAIRIRELGVDTPFRGQKLAARILGMAIDSDIYHGVPNTALSSVPKAIPMYSRLGFQHIDDGLFFGPVDAVRVGIANYLSPSASETPTE